jgi:hypothetical protein
MLKKILITLMILSGVSFAFDHRAYDIGGSEIGAKSSITINGKKLTLLPFSISR